MYSNGLHYRLIEPFQRGEAPTFIEHVKAGIRLLAGDESGLLVFSGYSNFPTFILEALDEISGCPC